MLADQSLASAWLLSRARTMLLHQMAPDRYNLGIILTDAILALYLLEDSIIWRVNYKSTEPSQSRPNMVNKMLLVFSIKRKHR
jgi:hypothetical protein